jgi:hypothetical protein
MHRASAQLLGLGLSLAFAACSEAAGEPQNPNAANGATQVEGYVAALGLGAPWAAAPAGAEPTAGFESSALPAHCAQRALNTGGLTFFVGGGDFRYDAAGLAFAPFAFVSPPAGLTAGPGTSTTWFLRIYLPPPLSSQQYDPTCGF